MIPYDEYARKKINMSEPKFMQVWWTDVFGDF